MRVYRRYLKYDPEGVEEYVAFLLGIGRVSERRSRRRALEPHPFTSKSGKVEAQDVDGTTPSRQKPARCRNPRQPAATALAGAAPPLGVEARRTARSRARSRCIIRDRAPHAARDDGGPRCGARWDYVLPVRAV